MNSIQDDDFGWKKDTDFNGNEFSHPDLGQVATFMEMICSGHLPQLEWKSPGKRMGTYQSNPSMKPAEKDSATRLFSSPIRTASNTKLVSIPSSPFDFDDSETFQSTFASPSHNTASPLRLEPRKRVVGTLNNALQSVQQADKLKLDAAKTSFSKSETPVNARSGPPSSIPSPLATVSQSSPSSTTDNKTQKPSTTP